MKNLNAEYLDAMVELDSDPEVMRYINGGMAVRRGAIANNFVPYVTSYDEPFGFWAMVNKASNKFIGWIFLRPETDFELLRELNYAERDATETGYRIRRKFWNQGYTTEATKALIEKSFKESGINKIVAWAIKENRASTRVMEKAGLQQSQEYLVTKAMIPRYLLESSLVQNLIGRPIVRYQITRDK